MKVKRHTLLTQKIDQSGLSRSEVADALNISVSTLYNKLMKLTDFTVSEVSELTKLLSLSEEDVLQIFFADNDTQN